MWSLLGFYLLRMWLLLGFYLLRMWSLLGFYLIHVQYVSVCFFFIRIKMIN
jgi:hypothetical protein